MKLRINKSKIWLTFFVFVALFEPPIFAVDTIYLSGVFTVILILLKNGKIGVPNKIRKSNIYRFGIFIAIMSYYLFMVSTINIVFINRQSLMINRLKCINQLSVITTIQMLQVIYILIYSDINNYKLKDIIDAMIMAGCIQGILSVIAIVSPTMREWFLRYSSVLNSAYLVERRGYGFSSVLYDTYGYGMGLLAGYSLLNKEISLLKKVVHLLLMMVSIFMNSRTGIIV